MFVRLTLADVNEGEMDNALEYVKNTVIPSYDGISGLKRLPKQAVAADLLPRCTRDCRRI